MKPFRMLPDPCVEEPSAQRTSDTPNSYVQQLQKHHILRALFHPLFGLYISVFAVSCQGNKRCFLISCWCLVLNPVHGV